MGTPSFALPTLEQLFRNYTVVGVVTQPDRPAGRGQKLLPSPVKEMALAEGVPVYQPARLRNVEAVEHIRAWAPDVIVIAAFGQILRAPILEIPRYGVLGVHPSLLPRWRGASPIQGALLAGDAMTGVTIMKTDEGMDTGAILATAEIPIGPEETAGELENRLAELGGHLLMQMLPDYLAGKLKPTPQPEEGITLTRPIDKDAARLEWTRPAIELHNQVRAFSPAPGAYTEWGGQRFKILRARVASLLPAPPDRPGTVFTWEKAPTVVTGDGCLVLLQVQMAGKRPMEGGLFIHGRRDFVGTVLGSRGPGD